MHGGNGKWVQLVPCGILAKTFVFKMKQEPARLPAVSRSIRRHMMQSDGPRSKDKQQDGLADNSHPAEDTPESLKCAPEDPAGKTQGRRAQAQAEQTLSPGEPAVGE